MLHIRHQTSIYAEKNALFDENSINTEILKTKTAMIPIF